MENRLSKNPTLTISEIFTRLLPNIMALGAVAAGSIKAELAARVAGTISEMGLISALLAIAAKMGKIISVLAIFEVSSVKKLMPVVMVATTIGTGTPSRALNLAPMASLKPLA